MSLRTYLKHIFIGEAVVLDEAGDVAFLDGDAHITISAHCGSQYAAKRPCLFCRWVCGFIQGVLGRIPVIELRGYFRVWNFPLLWVPIVHLSTPLWPNLKTHCANSWAAEKTAYLATKNLPGG